MEGDDGRERHSIDARASVKSSDIIRKRLEDAISCGEHLSEALQKFEGLVTAKWMKRINKLEAELAEMKSEFDRWQVLHPPPDLLALMR